MKAQEGMQAPPQFGGGPPQGGGMDMQQMQDPSSGMSQLQELMQQFGMRQGGGGMGQGARPSMPMRRPMPQQASAMGQSMGAQAGPPQGMPPQAQSPSNAGIAQPAPFPSSRMAMSPGGGGVAPANPTPMGGGQQGAMMQADPRSAALRG